MTTAERDVHSGVVVRRLLPDDVDLLRVVRLAALEESPHAFGETLQDARSSDWQVRAKNGALFSDRAVFIAIAAAAVPVGMVFVKCASPSELAFLGGMWVSPEFRRRGVGRLLVRQGLEFLRQVAQTEVSLWVTRGHDGVLAFYRALGFRDTGVTSCLRPGSEVHMDELRFSLADEPLRDALDGAQ